MGRLNTVGHGWVKEDEHGLCRSIILNTGTGQSRQDSLLPMPMVT